MAMPFECPRMLSIEKAAEYICVGVDVMRDMVRERKIPYVPNGRRYTIDRLDVDNWIEKRQQLELVALTGFEPVLPP